MSIDKPLEYSPGEKPADVTIGVVNPEAVTIETDDGGAIVIFNPEFEDEGEPEFGSNLADYIDDSELGRISQELVTHFDNDIRSRADWEKTYKSNELSKFHLQLARK